jgi:hypothetical protein
MSCTEQPGVSCCWSCHILNNQVLVLVNYVIYWTTRCELLWNMSCIFTIVQQDFGCRGICHVLNNQVLASCCGLCHVHRKKRFTSFPSPAGKLSNLFLRCINIDNQISVYGNHTAIVVDDVIHEWKSVGNCRGWRQHYQTNWSLYNKII